MSRHQNVKCENVNCLVEHWQRRRPAAKMLLQNNSTIRWTVINGGLPKGNHQTQLLGVEKNKFNSSLNLSE